MAIAASTRTKILLADDDDGLRRLIGTTLGSDEFELIAAADGEETLELARRERPDMMLLDINMPKVNGLEVCRLLKGDPATEQIRVIILTASGSDQDRRQAMSFRADDYFVKPFSPLALLDRVYSLLG
jgi:DNA-binding response OmpR family regulator